MANRRASPGMTYAPCPGCGRSESEHGYPHERPKDGVCRDCERKLKLFNTWAAERDVQPDEVLLAVPDFDALGHIPTPEGCPINAGGCHSPGRDLRRLLDVIGRKPVNEQECDLTRHWTGFRDDSKCDIRLVELVGRKHSPDTWRRAIIVTKAQADALVKFVESLRKGMESEYARIFRHGRSLLTGLANGTLSTSDFDAIASNSKRT